jgi:hypothetical protein
MSVQHVQYFVPDLFIHCRLCRRRSLT